MSCLIVFELLRLLTSGAVIKKCKYCGNYFVPQGRSGAVFCERIANSEAKPCRKIGALKLHKAAKADNPIHEAHRKAYRRMNAKARTKRVTQGEFFFRGRRKRGKNGMPVCAGSRILQSFKCGWMGIRVNERKWVVLRAVLW
ncbi:MAG: DUF6076 domain-containing protein [Oscillospiraceae bacterium]|nr:DUF6076 domain-containing protein [Oscillospiraceae bacterium]